MGLLQMDMDILPPSDDRVFKLILTHPDAKPVLKDLVSTVLKRPVMDVEVRNNDVPSENAEEKAERLDINCKIDSDIQADLEMQASRIEEDTGNQFANLKGKSIYYLCDLHASQPSKGLRRYDGLSQTFQITFCSYTVFPQWPEFFNSFSLRHDERNALLSDALHMIFIELSKLKRNLKRPVAAMTDLEKWAIFLRYANDAKYRETVNEIIGTKEVLQMAGELLMSISQDERERAVYRSRRMYQTDMQSNIATAEDRGRKAGRLEGKQEGILEGKIEIARNLLGLKLPINQIIQATGLTHDEIMSLRTNM